MPTQLSRAHSPTRLAHAVTYTRSTCPRRAPSDEAEERREERDVRV